MSRIRTSVGAAAALLTAAGLPLLATTQASAASGTLPWDFNGDGRADLAVGAPGEDVGSDVDAGSVSVFLADGAGAYSTSQVWTQDDNLGGAAEPGDQFGYATTSGDYNGDGYADLAVAANREDYGSGASKLNDVGIVTVLWGSASGITANGVVNLKFDVNGVFNENTFAGDALASGDMDDDGRDDLAVGGPGVELAKVYYGTSDEANFGQTFVNLSEYSLPGTKRFGDLFGESMVMGDFDDDGDADLVVGAPYDADDRGYSVGAVVVVPGGATGPDTAAAARWSPDSPGIGSAPHTFTVNDLPDSYGRTLAAGDFDGDGYDDLAAGIPGSPVQGVEDAGALNILYGSASGVSDRDTLFTQESTDIQSSSAKGDLFTASLDAGGGPGPKDLLAIGSAQEAVWVLPGNTGTGSRVYTQDTSGIFGGRETGDAFGAFVRFLSSTGSGNDNLAIGSPGESYSTGEFSAGVLYVLPSTTTVPTGTGSQKLEEEDPGVGGVRESGDGWGWLGDSH